MAHSRSAGLIFSVRSPSRKQEDLQAQAALHRKPPQTEGKHCPEKGAVFFHNKDCGHAFPFIFPPYKVLAQNDQGIFLSFPLHQNQIHHKPLTFCFFRGSDLEWELQTAKSWYIHEQDWQKVLWQELIPPARPRYITPTRSQRYSTMARSWAINKNVNPCSCCRCLNKLITCA